MTVSGCGEIPALVGGVVPDSWDLEVDFVFGLSGMSFHVT